MRGFRHISTKLLSLVMGVTLAMGGAVAAYFAIRSPIQAIRPERESLDVLESRLLNLRIEVNRLLTTQVTSQKGLFEETMKAYYEAFEEVSGAKRLPTLNASIVQALDVIMKVYDLSRQSLASLMEGYSVLVEATGGTATAPLDFMQLAFGTREETQEVSLRLSVFMKSVEKLDYILQIGDETIRKQLVLIDGEISGIESRAAILAAAIAAVIVIGTLAVALAVAASISRAVRRIDSAIAILKTGDLRQEIPVSGRDELGRLAENLNSFIQVLRGFHGRIEAASGQNLSAKEELAGAVASTISSNDEIGANARSISERMTHVGEMAEMTSSAVASVSEGFVALLGRIEDEMGLVESTVAAVTQMLASIANVSRITKADRDAVDSLVAESERGKGVFEESFDRVVEATSNADAIHEMAKVIKDVAERTNLLAMNAAIEAAHAGEYGRGFAVVADEIRGLAETATRSSVEISQNIEEVTKKMRNASGTRAATGEVFGEIIRCIGDVSRSVSEIYANTSEMEAGGNQILGTMQELKGHSMDLSQRSRDFEKATADLRQNAGVLNRIVSEVVSNLSEINSGLSFIEDSVKGVSDIAAKIGDVGDELDSEIRRFRTDGERAEEGA